MQFKKESENKPSLQKTIDALLEEMSSVTADSDEYTKMSGNLDTIYKLKEVDSKRRVTPDVIVTVVVNFIAIVWITRYERENVITSKSLQFLRTLRP